MNFYVYLRQLTINIVISTKKKLLFFLFVIIVTNYINNKSWNYNYYYVEESQ